MAALVLVACALVVVGSFLPWQTVVVDEGTVIDGGTARSLSFRGWDLTSDARVIVLLGLVGSALGALVATVRETIPLLLVQMGLVATGAIVAVIAALDIVDVQDGLVFPGVQSAVGGGLLVVVGGAVLLVAAGVAVQWRPVDSSTRR